MSKFGISADKEKALEARLHALKIYEKDLDETFMRSSGPGGQHVNKTSTCVRLTHRPTGISVKVQQGRSQGLNRFLARRLLADRLEEKIQGKASLQAQKRAKIHQRKQRRARRARQKVREETDERSGDRR
jgi:peptide chain release factor